MEVAELAMRFFRFFAREFDFDSHMVCIARAQQGELHRQPKDQAGELWVIRDPFKHDHNLAAHLTRSSRLRLKDAFKAADWTLFAFGNWDKILSDVAIDERLRFLKLTVLQQFNTSDLPKAVLELFRKCAPKHFFRPREAKQTGGKVDCFVEFANLSAMR